MTDVEVLNDRQRLMEIFHPYAMDRAREVRDKHTRLAHYTTAEAATNILVTKEVWMRKTSYMNDYMEVWQGSNV